MSDHRRSFEVSHGRGGAGNITPDAREYVDAALRREGNPESSGGAYSTGRGGHSNIASPRARPVATGDDTDIVPEQSKVIMPRSGIISTGRGGEGNMEDTTTGHRIDGKPVHHKTLEQKLKDLLPGHKKSSSKEGSEVVDTSI